jgi:putative transcriptional regulator
MRPEVTHKLGEFRDKSGPPGQGAGALLALALALVMSANSQPIPAGSLLEATAKSHDYDFLQSVVLVIHSDSQSALGLMLNKPTAVPISEVLPEIKDKTVTVYAGGPIAIGVRGLVRTKTAPFFSIVVNRPELLKLLSRDPHSVRIYAGCAGWTARQLESEVGRGLWRPLPANADVVFDLHPETLWRRLTLTGAIR